MDEKKPDEQIVRDFVAALRSDGLTMGVGKPYSREALESSLPSRGTVALVILGTLAFTALELGRGMRKTTVGTRRSYERFERHTADSLEVYERFEQSTMLIQRG